MCEICYIAQLPHRPLSAVSALSGIIYRDKKWPNGTTLNVSVLNGTRRQIDFIMEHANEWSQYANIKYKYVDRWEDGDARVQLHPSFGSWSYLGTDTTFISRSAPTMNLGWIDTDIARNDKSTVQHEFGHHKAMPHEHQNPHEPIPWRKEAVYARYSGPPNNWSREKIDHNIINVLSTEEIIATPLDRTSIMGYFFDGSLTLDGRGMPRNTSISAVDKQFIGQQYPFDDVIEEKEPINVELRRFLSHYFMNRMYLERATKTQLLICLGWLSVSVNPNESKKNLQSLLRSEMKKR